MSDKLIGTEVSGRAGSGTAANGDFEADPSAERVCFVA